jgi:hypothetical protein
MARKVRELRARMAPECQKRVRERAQALLAELPSRSCAGRDA